MRVVIHHRPSSPFLFSPFLPLHSSTPPSLSIRTENFSILRRRSCSLKLQRSISNRSGCRRGGAVVCMASASSATVPKPFRVLFVCLDDILESYEKWKVENSLPADARNKVKLMCTYCKQHKEIEVPDPYYGGPQGFEKVLDILEDACESLLDTILEKHFKDDCKGAN